MNTSETWSYYALRPIDNKLISQTVSIRQYESGTGLTEPADRIYTAVAMEKWAQSFLEAVELFLLNSFSQSDNRPINPDVARVLKAKSALSEAIPAAVAALFLTSPGGEDQITDARKALRIALEKNLSDGYQVATILVSKESGVVLFTPGQSNPLPNIVIPETLRAFPRLPILISQTCLATYPEATTADEAKQFDYTFRFACESRYQDSLYVHFDRVVDTDSNGTENNTALFTSLAQFIEVWPALQPDLPKKYNPAITPDKVLSTAIKTFADMVDQIADAWTGYWTNHSNQAPVVATNSYTLTKKYRLGNPTLLDVVFLTVPDPSVPVLPVIVVDDTDGNLHQLTPTKISDSKWMYNLGNAIDSHGKEFELMFKGNDLFSAAPFYPKLSLLRNNFDHIDPQFVSVTGNVAFADVEIPSVVQYEALALGNGTARLAALSTFFNELLSATHTLPHIKLEVSFAVQNEDMSIMTTPVLLIPETPYSESILSGLDVQLTAWLEAQGAIKGYFSMVLTFFNATAIPILSLQDVRFQ